MGICSPLSRWHRNSPGARLPVDLVTDQRGDRYGAAFPARGIHRFPSATLKGRSPLAAAKTGVTLLRGVAAAFGLFRRLQPAAVVGFGGYPSFAPIVAACLLRLPTLLHEQNAVLGRANRLLARHVTAVATSFEKTKFVGERGGTTVHYVGNPVRDSVLQWADQTYREPSRDGPFHLLIFGGSQGARYFSELVPAALAVLAPATRARLVVVQQCREEDLAQVKSAYLAQAVARRVGDFLSQPARGNGQGPPLLSVGPGPPPLPSLPFWAVLPSLCRCRTPSITIKGSMRSGLPNRVVPGALSKVICHPTAWRPPSTP